MKTTIVIPKLCKVGFNQRGDTYSGFLGYVIYNDGKVWRKETSWENWREKYITKEEESQLILNSYEQSVQGYMKSHYNNDTKQYESCTREEAIKYFGPIEEYNRSGILHKKCSDERINPFEFENIPTEGFVLNKKAGGTSWGWNPRATYCRVYDPQGLKLVLLNIILNLSVTIKELKPVILNMYVICLLLSKPMIF